MSSISSLLILALGIFGVLLVCSKDTVVPLSLRTNSIVKTLYDNSVVVGAICIAASYYLYTTLPIQYHIDSSSELTSATPEIPLPSQDVATSDLV